MKYIYLSMPWICLAVLDVACIASGTYLVVTEHYGWAWIPFLISCCTSVKQKKEKHKDNTSE